jgi:hypothetical protein
MDPNSFHRACADCVEEAAERALQCPMPDTSIRFVPHQPAHEAVYAKVCAMGVRKTISNFTLLFFFCFVVAWTNAKQFANQFNRLVVTVSHNNCMGPFQFTELFPCLRVSDAISVYTYICVTFAMVYVRC